MYTYVSLWGIPRAQWADMEKRSAVDRPVYDKAFASGGLVGFGDDMIVVHDESGITHVRWWSATSMAGVLNVLDQIFKSGSPASPVLAGAAKHYDNLLVSRYYNWKPGNYKDIYGHGSYYRLKPDAPDDAVAMLSQHLLVPMLEKLLADGTIVEYDIDTEAIHTEAPGAFYIFYATPTAEGLDKVNATIRELEKSRPLIGSAFDSLTELKAHRDFLVRSNATWK